MRKLYWVAVMMMIKVARRITGSAAAMARAVQKTGRGKAGLAGTAGEAVVVGSMLSEKLRCL